MSTVRVTGEWLALREPADAAARSRDLVERLALLAPGRWRIHDLGAGTGAMGRWLAPLLPGPQHWILHDRDEDLLAIAGSNPDVGAQVAIETTCSDITRLNASELAGATLITASALLDMLTEDELTRIVRSCAGAGCPVLLTLTVAGRVGFTPPDPLDRRLEAAFNDHQRRPTERGRLLGPDAAAFAAAEFRRVGAEVLVRDSPWRLDTSHRELAKTWLTGWVRAACEQRPELAAEADSYLSRRLEQAQLEIVTVGHADLLVLP